MSIKRDKPEKLWNMSFTALFIINIISNFSFKMVDPLLSKYAVSIGASLALAGTLTGIFAIMALIIRPVSGITADRFNKKNILLITLAITTLAILGHSISRTMPLLFLFRILHGAAFGISSTVNTALASSLIPKNRLGEGLSMFGLAMILSQAVAPSAGLAIISFTGFSMFFVIAALIQALAFVMMLFFPIKEEQTNMPREKASISLKDLVATESLIYAVLAGCFSIVNGVVMSFLVLFGENMGIKEIGLYFTVNSAALVISRLFLGKLIDRLNIKFLVYPTLALVLSGVLCLSLAHSIWPVLLAAVLIAFGHGTGQPAMQTSAIMQVSPERRGVATSTFFLGADIGMGIGPAIGGTISQYSSYSTMYALSAVPLVLGMLLFALFAKFNKKATAQKPLEPEAEA